MTDGPEHEVQHGHEIGGPERLLQERPAGVGGGNIGPPEAGRKDEWAGARRKEIGHGVDPLGSEIDVEESAIDMLAADEGDRGRDVANAADIETEFGQGVNERESDERLVLDDQNFFGWRIAGAR
jgi:hypothetical protein